MALATTTACAVLAAPTPPGLAADVGSEERVTKRGVRPADLPGPLALRRPAATSPQLSNGGVWDAEPLLISGGSAYRKGEFVYQDYLYDDRGAGTQAASPPNPSGSYSYPTDRRYAGNAADLLEVRTKLLRKAMAVRISYNTMVAPQLVATTLALGGSGQRVTWPHGAGASSPASLFVTVHGDRAEVVRAGSRTRSTLNTVTVRPNARQVEVRVPFKVFDPRGRKFRFAAASGLWDNSRGRYLQRAAEADANTPGGSASGGSELVNVAFRRAEPQTTLNPWRETQQASALARGDLSAFFATVDARKLARGATDSSTIPKAGFLNRVLVSHHEEKQGRGKPNNGTDTVGCGGALGTCDLAGRLQPYALFVPRTPAADGRYGLVLDLHNCNQTYNVRLGTDHVRQMARRGYLVLTPEARGSCYWYSALAQVDVWEAVADVLRHYPVDRNRIAIGGTSMGGYGAYKLATTFPAMFAAVAPIVPCVSADVAWQGEPTEPPSGSHTRVLPLLASLRNLPVMTWAGAADELCLYRNERGVHDELVELGYRSSFWTFDADHFTLSADRTPLADFIHSQRVERSPTHVSYIVRDRNEDRRWGLLGSQAYYLSGLRVSDREADREGRIDARTSIRGEGPPELVGPTIRVGTLRPVVTDMLSIHPFYNYVREDQSWRRGAPIRPRDRLNLVADGLSAADIDLRRAGLTCGAQVMVSTDRPLTIRWQGCPRRRTSHYR